MTEHSHVSRDALAQRIRAALASRDSVREVPMFGGLSFMVDDRLAVAAGREGDLLVHIDPTPYDALLREGGAPAFMGEDRPMGHGWLSVPVEAIRDDARLAYWVEVGIGSRLTSG
ncbi:TfoX-like protein [Glaciihabitans tibetensis]|uniref:TfoX-like protein n=1 Tax=Glaciihabitans tibetensis TaxID=1266600 RepID=A0A2T0VDT3_9MICO|nr:TfoX/Sxy family protein [Glaciihabitans tibetensis]PRY68336.1 TfoX-like protein [Glaciihabitans tibetensis]